MKRALVSITAILIIGAYLGTPTKGDDTPKERTYVGIFYCLHSQAVLDQRKSGKHDIVVGTSLPSLNPDSQEMKECLKDGGIPLPGYVQVTPPFASLNAEGKEPK